MMNVMRKSGVEWLQRFTAHTQFYPSTFREARTLTDTHIHEALNLLQDAKDAKKVEKEFKRQRLLQNLNWHVMHPGWGEETVHPSRRMSLLASLPLVLSYYAFRCILFRILT